LSVFYVDLYLIGIIIHAAILFRKIELQVLISVGVFKDVEQMNDREMFIEYEKMRKQSHKVRQKYKDQI
jgi:hypothetical protein